MNLKPTLALALVAVAPITTLAAVTPTPAGGVLVRIEAQAPKDPQKPVAQRPGLVAATYVDPKTDRIVPIRLRSEYILRSEPNQAQSRRLATAGEAALREDLFLTGETRSEVTPTGVKNDWVQVVYGEGLAWIQAGALVDPSPFVKSEVKPSVVTTQLQPQTRPMEREPAARPMVPPPTSLGANIASRAANNEPSCVSNFAEFQRSPRFQKAMGGVSPFTNWIGPMGASIAVNPSGTAVLNHPIKGMIPLTLSLCLDRAEVPYINVNGNVIYFDGPGFSHVSVADPESGQFYSFSRAYR